MSQLELRQFAIDVLKEDRKSWEGFSPLSDWLFPQHTKRLLLLSPKEAKEIAERDLSDQEDQYVKLAIQSMNARGIKTSEIGPADLEKEIAAIFEEFGMFEESQLTRPEPSRKRKR